MDCSKTVNYLKEKARMCSKIDCRNCPISSYNNGADNSCEDFQMHYSEEAIELVQKWSDKNQREIDWRKVPPNTPVFVSNGGGSNTIIPRLFCTYLPNGEHGKFVAYSEGKNRENAHDIAKWHFCSLQPSVDPTPYYEEA